MKIYEMLLANAMGESGGGGGGGGGDLSTAQVTIIGDGDVTHFYIPFMPYIDVDSLNLTINGGLQEDNSHTYTVALYKNKTIVLCYDTITASSGNVSVVNGVITITGDCSITIRPE